MGGRAEGPEVGGGFVSGHLEINELIRETCVLGPAFDPDLPSGGGQTVGF